MWTFSMARPSLSLEHVMLRTWEKLASRMGCGDRRGGQAHNQGGPGAMGEEEFRGGVRNVLEV